MADPKPSLTSPSEPSKPVPIVAIGASAGGQEAIIELLSHLWPGTGFAFVYVQHLNPSYKSQLVSILGRAGPRPCPWSWPKTGCPFSPTMSILFRQTRAWKV